MKDKRKEAILWVKALMGETEGTNLEYADYNDIMLKKDIDEFKEDPIEVKWGLEEGAIRILRKLFDIRDNEIYSEMNLNIEEKRALSILSDLEQDRVLRYYSYGWSYQEIVDRLLVSRNAMMRIDMIKEVGALVHKVHKKRSYPEEFYGKGKKL